MERWKRGTGRGGRRTCGEKLLAESGPVTCLARQTGETDALPLPEIADKGQGRGGRGHDRGTGYATADEAGLAIAGGAGLAQGRGGGVTDHQDDEAALAPGTVHLEEVALVPGTVHLEEVDLAPGTVHLKEVDLAPGTVHLKEVDLAPGTVHLEEVDLAPGTVHLEEVDLTPGTVHLEEVALVPGTVHLKEVDLAPRTIHLERAPGTACESQRSSDGADLGHEKSGGVDLPHGIGTGSNTTTYTMHNCCLVTVLLLLHTSILFTFYNCVLHSFL